MFSVSKRHIFLLAVPLLLLAALFWTRKPRPDILPGIGGRATVITFSPDGKTVVCASSNNYVQIWKLDIKKWRSFASAGNYMTNLPPLFLRLRFSPDGKSLYAGGSFIDASYSSVAHCWDVTTRRRKFAFNALKSPAFDISRDGRWAALGYASDVHLIDLKGKSAPPRKGQFTDPPDYRFLPFRKLATGGNVTCVAFSPDSKTLVVGDGTTSWPGALWDVKTARRVASKGSATSLIPSFLEWSPDGKRVAASGGAGIAVYDVANGSIVQVAWPATTVSSSGPTASFPGAAPQFFTPGDVAVLAWSPDGQTLFSGGSEVRQWKAKDLQLTRSFGVAGPVAISPDGKTLATAKEPRAGEPDGVLMWKL